MIVPPAQIVENVMAMGYTMLKGYAEATGEAQKRLRQRFQIEAETLFPEPAIERDRKLCAVLEAAGDAVAEYLDEEDPGRVALCYAADMLEHRALTGIARSLWDARARVEMLRDLSCRDPEHGLLPDDLPEVLHHVWQDFFRFGQREARP
jgi:hypothetical protein